MSTLGRLFAWSALAACLFACQPPPRTTPFAKPAPRAETPATAFVAAAPSSSTALPPPAPMTPVEQAVAQHRNAILKQRGVVAVDAGVLPDGTSAMFIEMCAEEAKKTLALPELAMPVHVFVDPASTRASSKPCGCVGRDAYYEPGEVIRDGCNNCRCHGLCLLFDCELKIMVRVYFKANSAVPLPETNSIYAEIVAILRDKQDFLIDVQGYADKGEKDPQGLSLRRARAVYDRLIAAGASPKRLRGPTALGTTKPVANDNPDFNRYVGFEVVMQPRASAE